MTFLAFLGRSPDAALLVCTLGIALIYIELNRPGLILSGATGLLLVLIGVAALSRWPVRWPSLSLIAFAMLTLAAGLRLKISGLISTLAVAVLMAGTFFLVRGSSTHVHLATALIVGISLGAGTTMLTAIARRARTNKGLD